MALVFVTFCQNKRSQTNFINISHQNTSKQFYMMACRAVAHQSTHALVRRFIGKTSSKSSSSNNRRAMLSTSVLSFLLLLSSGVSTEFELSTQSRDYKIERKISRHRQPSARWADPPRLRKRNNAIYVKNAAKITPSGTANAPGAKRGTP